jgi:hypothetical protein
MHSFKDSFALARGVTMPREAMQACH